MKHIFSIFLITWGLGTLLAQTPNVLRSEIVGPDDFGYTSHSEFLSWVERSKGPTIEKITLDVEQSMARTVDYQLDFHFDHVVVYKDFLDAYTIYHWVDYNECTRIDEWIIYQEYEIRRSSEITAVITVDTLEALRRSHQLEITRANLVFDSVYELLSQSENQFMVETVDSAEVARVIGRWGTSAGLTISRFFEQQLQLHEFEQSIDFIEEYWSNLIIEHELSRARHEQRIGPHLDDHLISKGFQKRGSFRFVSDIDCNTSVIQKFEQIRVVNDELFTSQLDQNPEFMLEILMALPWAYF